MKTSKNRKIRLQYYVYNVMQLNLNKKNHPYAYNALYSIHENATE